MVDIGGVDGVVEGSVGVVLGLRGGPSGRQEIRKRELDMVDASDRLDR